MTLQKKSRLTTSLLGFTLLCSLVSAPLTAYGEGAQYTPSTADQHNSPTPDGHLKRHHHGHHFGGFAIKTTAELIGMDKEDLVSQLKTGRTLVQIVKEKKGWSESEYLSKLVGASSNKIDKAVQNGKIDAERANKIKAALPDKLKETVNRNWAQTFSKPENKGTFREHEAKLSK